MSFPLSVVYFNLQKCIGPNENNMCGVPLASEVTWNCASLELLLPFNFRCFYVYYVCDSSLHVEMTHIYLYVLISVQTHFDALENRCACHNFIYTWLLLYVYTKLNDRSTTDIPPHMNCTVVHTPTHIVFYFAINNWKLFSQWVSHAILICLCLNEHRKRPSSFCPRNCASRAFITAHIYANKI